MYTTIVDISFLEMGLYAVDAQAEKFHPCGYGHRCIGNDGYPSGFL